MIKTILLKSSTTASSTSPNQISPPPLWMSRSVARVPRKRAPIRCPGILYYSFYFLIELNAESDYEVIRHKGLIQLPLILDQADHKNIP